MAELQVFHRVSFVVSTESMLWLPWEAWSIILMNDYPKLAQILSTVNANHHGNGQPGHIPQTMGPAGC
jgi:hypothetical protein